MKWHFNTEAEGNISTGIYSLTAKTDMGVAGESRESSRDTSTRLTETMQKVASKIRNESRVVVSTDTEDTFESSSATEIQNPNDEIAVTYVYSKLQNQYEVLTRLAEIQNVVMVAEALPPPAEIDFDWVKRHDWIIAKVLLDDSFRDAVTSISQEARSPDSSLLVTDLRGARDATIGHLGTFAATANVRADNIDMVVESQRSYTQSAREQLEQLKITYEIDAKRDRLYQHIRDNILYYCRAIWQEEDPQQRLLRYQKLGKKLPLEWRFEPLIGDSMTIDQFVTLIEEAATTGMIDGQFVPVVGGREVPLHEVLNPAGPIGYYGNYALYYMRPEFVSGEVFAILHFVKSPYLYFDSNQQADVVMDPVQIQFAESNPITSITNQMIDAVVDEMVAYVPELRLALARARDSNDPAAETQLRGDYTLLRNYYAEFLFRKEQTRRFVVDANSLVIDLIPGNGSALEPFKRVHRAIDAERELEENKRRTARRLQGDLRDPDVKKVIIVERGGTLTTQSATASSVAATEATDATSATAANPSSAPGS
jgi:hypothetical protein